LAKVDREGDPHAPARTVSISVKLEILDTNDLLAVDVSGPVVFGLLDHHGNPVQWLGDPPGNTRDYHKVGMEITVEGASHIDRMMPCATSVELPLDPSRPLPSSLSSVKGYLYALYVDEIIEVDIPYDPNGGWVDSATAPDLMLCVDPGTPPPPGPAEHMPIPAFLEPLWAELFGSDPTPLRRKAVSLCCFLTFVKSRTGRPVMALEDVWYRPEVRALVEHVVIETQLFDSRRNSGIRFPTGQWARSDGGRGATCQGRTGQDLGPFDTIRHVIGVHPVEVKIPFVLENVPVPVLQSCVE
jgi:hypothetical protein